MKIFKLNYESYRSEYRGYFTSLDKAFELLPKDVKFRRVLSQNSPYPHEIDGIEFMPDHSFNEKMIPEFHLNGTRGINVILNGARFKTKRKILIPEVKKEGEPYKAARTEYELLEDVFKISQVSVSTFLGPSGPEFRA